MEPIKTILVPFDFTAPSEAALAYAVDLAEDLGARVFLLHAFEVPLVGFPDNTMPVSADAASRIIDAAQESLDRAVSKLDGRKVEVVPILRAGDPRVVIPNIAADVNADVLVMGTHGRRGLSRALIGSVTESIIRTAKLPVLAIHAPLAA